MQVDIKRVLAWSTVSQIGYMIMGAGLGAYDSSMFHLLTHAFFKALLFLGVGIAIHALAGEQSLDRMGGLRQAPCSVTPLAVLVGCLAISGIPPFSGFFSKDEILATALDAGHPRRRARPRRHGRRRPDRLLHVPPVLPRLLGPRAGRRLPPAPPPAGPGDDRSRSSILAVLATIGGLLEIPGVWHPFGDWLEPALPAAPDLEASHGDGGRSRRPPASSWSAIGIGLAWWIFVADPQRRLRLAGTATGARTVLHDQYRFDDVYEDALVQPGRDLGDVLTDPVERVRPCRARWRAPSRGRGRRRARPARCCRSGLVRGYVLAMVAGVAVIGIIFSLAVR